MRKARVVFTDGGNYIEGAITLFDRELIDRYGRHDSLQIPCDSTLSSYEDLREEAVRRVKERYSLEDHELEIKEPLCFQSGPDQYH